MATKSVTRIVPVSSLAMEDWGPKEGGNATSPLHSLWSPNKGGRNQNWLPHLCLLGGPKEGGNATPHPAFLVIPKQRGTKSEVATKSVTKIVSVPSIAPEGWGPKEGGNAMPPLHSRGFPNTGEQTSEVDTKSVTKIVPVSSIAPEGWGPKEGGNATSPLHSRGSPTKGTKSYLKTYARGNNDAPSISQYGCCGGRQSPL